MSTLDALLLKQATLLADLQEVSKEISVAVSLLQNQTLQTKVVVPAKHKVAKPQIIQVAFPDNQYMKENTLKTGTVWHHTAGSQEGQSVYTTWANDKQGRVATNLVLNRNGQFYTGFADWIENWGHAIGLTVAGNNLPQHLRKYHNFDNNVFLNKRYIQIELCSWGWLTEKKGKYYSWANVEVPKEKVITYEKGFRGAKYFERYTDEQIESMYNLINWLYEEYGISKKYNTDMFDISENALLGKEGIWSHTSFRTDKSDLHPQPELVKMLQSL